MAAHDDEFDDMTAEDFDAALAGAEQVELVFDRRVRVSSTGRAIMPNAGSRTGNPTRITVSSVVLTNASG